MNLRICRICLRPTSSMCFVLDSLVPKFNSPPASVLNQWKMFSNMLIATEEHIPDKICKTCAVEIQQMYLFILKCERSDHMLRKMLNVKVHLKKLKMISVGLRNEAENREWSQKSGQIEGFQVSEGSDRQDSVLIRPTLRNNVIESDYESTSSIDNEVFKCPACRYECKMIEVLEKHLINDHTDGKMCKHCNQEFECKAIEHFTKFHRRVISMEGVINFKTIKFHKCKICSKLFKYKSILEKHLMLHTNGRSYKCAICLKSFRHKYRLTAHLKFHGKELFKCEICSELFVNVKKLLIHLRRHRKENRIRKARLKKKYGIKNDIYKCPACRLEFRMMEGLEKHIIDNHMDGQVCRLCSKELECKAIEHFTKSHRGMDKPAIAKCTDLNFMNLKFHKCKVCWKLFKYKARLKKHSIAHKDEKPFKCNICSKTFKCKSRLTKHMKVHVAERPSKNGCANSEQVQSKESKEDSPGNNSRVNEVSETAQKQSETNQLDAVAATQGELDISMKNDKIDSENESTSSSSTDTEIYKCPACSYDCKTMEILEKHITDNHMNGSVCKLCNQEFECRSIEHFSQCHANKSKACFECKICSKIFRYTSNLKRHHDLAHRNEELQKSSNILESESEDNKCNVCSKIFRFKFQLNRHITIHTTEKPFKCDFCSKGFLRNFSLMQHLKNHDDERPFKCELCPKTFKTEFRFTEHLKFHTGDKPFKCEFCPKSFPRKNHLTLHLKLHSK